MSDDEYSDEDDSWMDGDEEDDSAEAKRRDRRQYRGKVYRSKGVISKEWITCRDAMRRGDTAGYTKLATMIHKNGTQEAIHGSWGGMTLLHVAAKYGCVNCVKRLMLDGANPSRTNTQGDLPLHLARKKGHDSLALIIEFWDSPTTNRRIEGGPNLNYDPASASKKAAANLVAETKKVEKKKALQAAAEEEGVAMGVSVEDTKLAKDLGVVLVQKGPPKTSKQPTKVVKRESMGKLENTDDRDGLLSEYQKFRLAEEEEAEAEAEDALVVGDDDTNDD